MSTITAATPVAPALQLRPANWAALSTVVRRRFALTVRTPRELAVPLLTPILFALIIAPALSKNVGAFKGGVDYMSFVALATAGLLIPLNMMFSGVGVVVDRDSGARRNLLVAPIARPLIVVGNLIVALAITALQLGTLLIAAALRGAHFSVTVTGAAWTAAAALMLAIGMHGVAEVLANRMPTVEEYIAAVPAIAIVPWFFAGSLFPLTSLPLGLAAIAKVLPLTHALALIRYGLIDHNGHGLHAIWGMSNTTVMAALSLAVLTTFALAMTAIAIRVFTHSVAR
jgi:ABC-type polysaccharide/polyol phosphate export permease